MAKRLLLLADAGGIWTRRLIDNVLLPGGYQVVLFPIWGVQGVDLSFYQQRSIPVYHDGFRLPVIRHIPRVRMWARISLNARRLCRQYGPFDVVANHYLSQRDLALGGQVARRFHARWVCCFWGSDLLRASPKQLKQMAPYLRRCDSIHSVYGLLRQRMQQLYGPAVAQKSQVLQFGQATFDCIDRLRAQHTRAECKAHFGIEADRFVLCVGYSAAKAQRQLQVLQALQSLPRERLERMTLVLSQTYCMDDRDYMLQAQALARSLPCQTVVLTQFMSDEETAWLRLAADAFILAITTDAFCATLREYLYAGARVMHGDWLTYQQLEDMGLHLPKFHDFDQLPALVERAMEADTWPGLTPEQAADFRRQFSAQALLPQWLALYEPGQR